MMTKHNETLIVVVVFNKSPKTTLYTIPIKESSKNQKQITKFSSRLATKT